MLVINKEKNNPSKILQKIALLASNLAAKFPRGSKILKKVVHLEKMSYLQNTIVSGLVLCHQWNIQNSVRLSSINQLNLIKLITNSNARYRSAPPHRCAYAIFLGFFVELENLQTGIFNWNDVF